ncbi:mandelate racemase/muconate lactonizing enzyme family protein [Bacillus sp. 1P06AnD]|uniref:mandelate racemase/muconate lactonizing enzyme family protein n=1 Tax=Bacillus sp. 1P06AnD TaxID=3132208 RepID=UPI0039A3B401
MIIEQIEISRLSVPLVKPFKTALRTVLQAESIVVKIQCDNGITGWGEAPPTHVITGDSLPGIAGAIEQVLKPVLLGQNALHFEKIFHLIERSLVGNPSAKAAVDMALYDCLAQSANLPLYQYLGGYRNTLETDFTVSVNSPAEMGKDAESYCLKGFNVLKVKVGKDEPLLDVERIKTIRQSVGKDVNIRLDANQGWSVKAAIQTIRKLEDSGLGIELIEQPVHREDIQGLRMVTNAVETPIMADESVFSLQDAFEVLKTRSADLINIKLMKCGGIQNALQINKMAELCGVECMIGSMIETKLGLTAAAHLAASQKNITRFDLDAALMLKSDPLDGGISYDGRHISFADRPGMGILTINGLKGVSYE